MTQEEFAQQLASWKQQFLEEVVVHYQRNGRERGRQAFDRWAERFALFLQGYAPGEAERFKRVAEFDDFTAGLAGPALYDVFMLGAGNKCLAFIDELADSARKDRILSFQEVPSVSLKRAGTGFVYVNPGRIQELRAKASAQFDLAKLIKLCEELNFCFANECYLSVAMLVRSIVDHIPAIFGSKTFAEVANNYAGTRSFKASMQNLENSSRNIADAHLHVQIRNKETLPNETQVNFSNDLDVLLGEIVRILK